MESIARSTLSGIAKITHYKFVGMTLTLSENIQSGDSSDDESTEMMVGNDNKQGEEEQDSDEETKSNLEHVEAMEEQELITYKAFEIGGDYLKVGGCSNCQSVGIYNHQCSKCTKMGDSQQHHKVFLLTYGTIVTWVD